jgi:prepilin-type N-terminal cleavage/methylation domain-containing protein
MRSLARAEGGFTLIELVVTMMILLTVVTTITAALVSATNTEADQNNRFQTQQQARIALTKLTREIHCANTLQGATTLQGGNVTSPSALGATPANTLIVALPAGCPTGGATAVTARWCTVPESNGIRYDLYRSTSSTCWDPSQSACPCVRWATSLVNATPFSLPAAATSGTHMPLVHLDLTINARTTSTVGQYDLTDDVAALNSTRTVTG